MRLADQHVAKTCTTFIRPLASHVHGIFTGGTHESGERLGSSIRLPPHLAAHLSSGGIPGMPQGVHQHDYPKGPVCVFVGEGRGVWVAGQTNFHLYGGAPGVAMWPPPGFVVQPLHAILNESRSSHEGWGERVEWGERAPYRSRVRGGGFQASGT